MDGTRDIYLNFSGNRDVSRCKLYGSKMMQIKFQITIERLCNFFAKLTCNLTEIDSYINIKGKVKYVSRLFFWWRRNISYKVYFTQGSFLEPKQPIFSAVVVWRSGKWEMTKYFLAPVCLLDLNVTFKSSSFLQKFLELCKEQVFFLVWLFFYLALHKKYT